MCLRRWGSLLLLLIGFTISAQPLHPGFDAKEYDGLLDIIAKSMDTTKGLFISNAGQTFTRVYQSPEVGLKNRWEFYRRSDGVAIIHIRGTINHPTSWLANFYAAMVPAKGRLVLAPKDTFYYQLATRPRASVHVGWLLSMAHLVKDMKVQLPKLINASDKSFIVVGHSQGAGIAALLRAYLRYEQLLPKGAQIKTYCSAAPKPGDLFFSHEFDSPETLGWSFRIVNSYDWVPQVPFSNQTIEDFNNLNPFRDVKKSLAKASFLERLYLSYAYQNIHKKTDQAASIFTNYLGNDVFLLVKKALPSFQKPTYSNTNQFYPVGTSLVLTPNESYFKDFPDTSSNIFIHHMIPPYKRVLRLHYPEVK